MTDDGICVNTRSNNPNAETCDHALQVGKSCKDFLKTKDCDAKCNLCACSTSTHDAKFTGSEHCSGHGTCQATCSYSGCTGAICKCEDGWGGPLCDLGKTIYIP